MLGGSSFGQIWMKPVWPWWLLVALAVVVTGLAFWHGRAASKRLGKEKGTGLALLRWVAFLLLIFFAFDPSVLIKKFQSSRPSLAILVDGSQSMGLSVAPGGKKPSRFEQASLLLEGEKDRRQDGLLAKLDQRYDLRMFSFSNALRPLAPGELASIQPTGTDSDLLAALAELTRQEGSRPDGVLVLSDGNIRWPPGAENLAKDMKLPVFSSALGNPKDYKDLAITEVKAPSLAFRGKAVTLEVTVKAYGYAGQSVPVILKRGEKLLARTQAAISTDPYEARHSLTFIPEEKGLYRLSLSAALLPGEKLSINNSFDLAINVLRDKIRVLMVSGSPSFGYRFLRLALKGDPSVDLLSFVILRTPTDVMNVPSNEQALIPFPVETLFDKELKSFDLVIFDNFSYSNYFGTQYLENLKEFVKGGGAFAMLGGRNSFSEGGYQGTPLDEVLPVRMRSQGSYGPADSPGLKLTKAGQTHPLTRLAADPRENAALWNEFDSLEGLNRLESSPRGTTLVTTESGAPILAVGSFGQGRALALASDYSWKWYQGLVARGRSNRPYLRLISQLARWLVADPSMSVVQILPLDRPQRPGQEMEVRVRLRQEEVASKTVQVSLHAFDPEGARQPLPLQADSSGEYSAKLLVEKEGTYLFKAEARSQGELIGQDEAAFVVPAFGPELADAAPRPDLLKRLAEATGGQLLSFSPGVTMEAATSAIRIKGSARLAEERRLPLWANPYALVLVLAFLSGEWFLRRRWGLV